MYNFEKFTTLLVQKLLLNKFCFLPYSRIFFICVASIKFTPAKYVSCWRTCLSPTFQTKKFISYNTDKRYSLQRPEVPSGMCQKVILQKSSLATWAKARNLDFVVQAWKVSRLLLVISSVWIEREEKTSGYLSDKTSL